MTSPGILYFMINHPGSVARGTELRQLCNAPGFIFKSEWGAITLNGLVETLSQGTHVCISITPHQLEQLQKTKEYQTLTEFYEIHQHLITIGRPSHASPF